MSDRYTIVLIPKAGNPFSEEVYLGCYNEAFASAEGEMQCVSTPPSRADAYVQATLIRDIVAHPTQYGILSEKYGLAIAVIDETITGAAIDYVRNQNISVITFDYDAPKSSRMGYVGANNTQVGVLLGQALNKISSDGGNYSVITGFGPGLRVQGLRSMLMTQTKWVEVNEPPFNCMENSTLALEQMYRLAERSDIQGIISVGPWPMFKPEPYTQLANIYKNNKTIVVGGATDIQQKLYNSIAYVRSFVGPSPNEIGSSILKTFRQILAEQNQTKDFSVEVPIQYNDDLGNKTCFYLVSKFEKSPFYSDVFLGFTQSSLSTSVDVYYKAPQTADAYKQAEVIKNIVDDQRLCVNVAGIAVSVIDENITRAAIDYATSKNISVITFESDAPTSSRLLFVSVNHTDLGVKLGEAFSKKHGEPRKGTYKIIAGSGQSLKQRINGVRSVLNGTDWVESTPPFNCNDDATLALNKMYELSQDPDIQGIISVGGWPTFEFENFIDFRKKYENTTRFVIGDVTSIQLGLAYYRMVDELIGPLPYSIGNKTFHALLNAYKGQPLPEYNIQLLTAYSGWRYLTEVSIGDLAIVGYTFFAVVTFCSIVSLYWTYTNRETRTVRVAQPVFMAMLCIGAIIAASAMVPLGIENSNNACMSIPWLLVTGFCTMFSALFSKTWRLVKLMKSAERFRRTKLNLRELWYPYFVIMAANIIILACWTYINPLVYRITTSDVAIYGHCTSKNQDMFGKAKPFIVCLAVVNGVLLILANWMAFRSRKVHVEFRESRYISLIMFSMLQIFVLGIPLLFAVLNQPQAYYIVMTMLDFTVCMSTLLFMFIPKVLAQRNNMRSLRSRRMRAAKRPKNNVANITIIQRADPQDPLGTRTVPTWPETE